MNPGREIFERLMKAAGVGSEERKEYLLAGGATSGYEVRVSGAFLTLSGPPGGAGRRIVLVRRKIHSATRALLGTWVWKLSNGSRTITLELRRTGVGGQ